MPRLLLFVNSNHCLVVYNSQLVNYRYIRKNMKWLVEEKFKTKLVKRRNLQFLQFVNKSALTRESVPIPQFGDFCSRWSLYESKVTGKNVVLQDSLTDDCVWMCVHTFCSLNNYTVDQSFSQSSHSHFLSQTLQFLW